MEDGTLFDLKNQSIDAKVEKKCVRSHLQHVLIGQPGRPSCTVGSVPEWLRGVT